MRRRKLFTIADAFDLAGRGVVVTGEPAADAPACRIGSAVVIVHPDGRELTAEVSGIEFIKPLDYESFDRKTIGLLLKNVASKEDAPAGAQIFLVVSDSN